MEVVYCVSVVNDEERPRQWRGKACAVHMQIHDHTRSRCAEMKGKRRWKVEGRLQYNCWRREWWWVR